MSSKSKDTYQCVAKPSPGCVPAACASDNAKPTSVRMLSFVQPLHYPISLAPAVYRTTQSACLFQTYLPMCGFLMNPVNLLIVLLPVVILTCHPTLHVTQAPVPLHAPTSPNLSVSNVTCPITLSPSVGPDHMVPREAPDPLRPTPQPRPFAVHRQHFCKIASCTMKHALYAKCAVAGAFYTSESNIRNMLRKLTSLSLQEPNEDPLRTSSSCMCVWVSSVFRLKPYQGPGAE